MWDIFSFFFLSIILIIIIIIKIYISLTTLKLTLPKPSLVLLGEIKFMGEEWVRNFRGRKVTTLFPLSACRTKSHKKDVCAPHKQPSASFFEAREGNQTK